MAAARKPARKAPAEKHDEAYVAGDSLSWRPFPLPRGAEVSEILPADVLKTCLADGRVTHEPPNR